MTRISKADEHPTQDTKSQNKEALSMESIQSLDEFESLAIKHLSKKAWSFNYAAAGDLISKRQDQEVYRSILLRPRVLVNVKECDLSTTITGQRVGLPIFVSPMAMARLAHPTGEAAISAACGVFGAMHIISNNASMVPEEIIAGAAPDQVFGFQLYVQTDRTESEAVLARINKLPAIKCIVLTVDEPVQGKHELGPRGFQQYDEVQTEAPGEPSPPSADVRVAIPSISGPASDAEWEVTLQWLAKHTSLPIIIKGIQTYEDAELAATYAPQVKGIILSNHGGRVLDTAPPAIHTLLEIRKYCPEALEKLEVMVDGGIRRGTDVVKALCLGARAVGIGRPAFWGLGAGGVAGVERTLQILAQETRTCMGVLGVRRIADLGTRYVNARIVEQQIYNGDSI
ncbi:Aldolase-type TIM barrel [Penicillium expansum]|uniref:Aldolase-type TIM barrel n=1 Tax=Penicillium expansum TaxID=27334 RepID=A0A0A2IRQ3_PENEN|nr:Aldolase-type TIM barrel [Penicillium expansum]KGO45734.1 Aldolase-type TIM barrel [Penicillium expansum]KGO57996.1 Aldolase-type TIM barrel [Penicillium expansum]